MTGAHIQIGTAVLGSRGELLGHVGAIYVDNATGVPVWAAVQGREHTAVVPLAASRLDGDTLHIPYGADRLRHALYQDPDTLISCAAGDELARHYALLPATPDPDPANAAKSDPAKPETARPVAARSDTARPGTAREDGVMVRSGERLRVGAVNVVVGRARLVTFVVTENQTFTVPVSRQEVRLVYDPVPADEQVISAAPPAEETHEVVLHTEQVLVTKQIVPIERVRMLRRVVTTGQAITEQVRSEQIDLTHTDASAGEQPWE